MEAKASGQGIAIDKTTGLAKRLRPDVVTLAVMEAGLTELTARLSQLRQQLTGEEIAAELLMILGPDDIDDSPFLPTA